MKKEKRVKKNGNIHSEEQDGPQPYELPNRDYVECPACEKKIVWEPTKENKKRWVPCNPKLRIVVFNIPENDITKIPHEQVVRAVEVGTGRYVVGRVPDETERDYFAEYKTLDRLVPWCIGRLSHFTTCERLDKWLNGEAEYPSTIESGDTGNTPAIEGGSHETNE